MTEKDFDASNFYAAKDVGAKFKSLEAIYNFTGQAWTSR